MTMGYGLPVPLMLATAGAYVLVPRGLSLFKSQVDARVDSPAHEGEFVAMYVRVGKHITTAHFPAQVEPREPVGKL